VTRTRARDPFRKAVMYILWQKVTHKSIKHKSHGPATHSRATRSHADADDATTAFAADGTHRAGPSHGLSHGERTDRGGCVTRRRRRRG
jgi:hypothetical protein